MSFVKVIGSIFAQVSNGTPIWKVTIPAWMHTDKSTLDMTRIATFSQESSLLLLNQVAQENDPVKRMALVLSALVNPNITWTTDKPFSATLGEFLVQTTEIQVQDKLEQFRFTGEQISNHPPITAYEIQGPTFKIYTPEGVGHTVLKPGFNYFDITWPTVRVKMHTKIADLEWSYPSIRVEPIFGSKRVSYIHGDIRIKDSSGFYFIGRLKKNHAISGEIYDAAGKVLFSVDGDMLDGVFFKGSPNLWAAAAASDSSELVLKSDEQYASDPKFSPNVISM